MTAKNNKDKCLFCGGCIAVCPFLAIELQETRIVIDPEKCKDCGSCVKVCPAGAMTLG